MTWPPLALATAFCQNGQDLLARSLLRRFGLSGRLAMGAGCLLAVALGLPVALAGGPRHQAAVLVGALFATDLVNGLAFWAYGRALRSGALSLVLPLTNLSPLVLLGSGWGLLGDKPGPLALVGLPLLLPALVAGEARPLALVSGRPGSGAIGVLLLFGALGALGMVFQMEAVQRTAQRRRQRNGHRSAWELMFAAAGVAATAHRFRPIQACGHATACSHAPAAG
jgi:hypothetical protein